MEKEEVIVNTEKEDDMILHLKNQNESLDMPSGFITISRSQRKNVPEKENKIQTFIINVWLLMIILKIIKICDSIKSHIAKNKFNTGVLLL